MKSSNFYSNALNELESYQVVVADVKTRYYRKLEIQLAKESGAVMAKFTILNLEMRKQIIKAGIKGDYYAVENQHDFNKVFENLHQARHMPHLAAA